MQLTPEEARLLLGLLLTGAARMPPTLTEDESVLIRRLEDTAYPAVVVSPDAGYRTMTLAEAEEFARRPPQ